MQHRFSATRDYSAAWKAHSFGLVIWLAALSIWGTSVAAQSVTGDRPADWKLHTTSEKEFSFLMPETSTIYHRGEYRRGVINVFETTEVSAFYQGCAMVVRIFKTNDPQGVFQLETKPFFFHGAKRTELKGRGVKAYSFVNHKDGVYFEALGLINKGQLYLIQAGARGEDNAYLKQFLASVTLKGMTGVTSAPPAITNNAPPPNEPTTPEDPPEAATPALRPVVIYAAQALYNDLARANRVQGTIVVSAVFTTTGEVTNIRIIRGLPDGLDQEAFNAARRIRFLPALKNGKPVSVRMSMEFSFNLL